ncbi:hypothetical protein [Flavobacterium enshiense]|uniref:GIY-YIG domain-containing protein n=1 Tax=Flavobacterium enshiense DK69 TaxID=1107311 RepID=A0A0A2MVT7_9FLAO|nr:hypothetical protein [Flavobacterium enshiense]KGO95681.1 hypothetical protein Q767_10720 [Flavobacterium enshiense DK69]
MKIKSSIKEDLEGSFVYLIFSRELLYIGETQKITFSRWIQHFYYKGTFYKKIENKGLKISEYLNDLNLISVELTEVRNDYSENRWKVITQAVEHAIHEELSCYRTNLMKNYYEKYYPYTDSFEIISDTSRTCPKSIPNKDWDYARNYASKILIEIYNYL